MRIVDFQPMPKRFMIWNKIYGNFATNRVHPDGVYDMASIADILRVSVTSASALDNYIFIQSTNLFDKDGKEIFEGSIVRRAWEVVGDGESAPLFLVVWSPSRAEFALKYGIFHNGVEQIIDKKAFKDVVVVGHILSDPGLLGEVNNA